MKLRLRTKLAMLVSTLVVILMLLLSVYSTNQSMISNRALLRKRADIVTKMVALPQILNIALGKPVPPMAYEKSLEIVMGLDQSLAYVVITDGDGKVVAGKVNPTVIETDAGAKETAILRELAQEGKGSGTDLKVFAMEILSEGSVAKNVKVGFDTRPMQRQLRNMVTTQIAITIAFILLGMAASGVLAHGITRPIKTLAEAMAVVQQGNFDARVSIKSRDEIGELADSFNFMTAGLAEREWLKNTFSRYVSRQVAQKILKEKKDLNLEGELRKVTILFADIRGFTSLAENLSPREVVSLLNEYFKIMIDIIFKYDGTLDKFVGDQIMVVFGAPLDQDEPELRAVRTALEMQAAIAQHNRVRTSRGQPPIYMGIGINTGEVIAGNIGSEKRMEYTVIGDEVNLAERIESTTPKDQTLISESTYEAVKDKVEATMLEPIAVKGREAPAKLYSVAGMRS